MTRNNVGIAVLLLVTAATMVMLPQQASLPIADLQGTGVPAVNCTVGQRFFSTDADPGANLYLCTATNTWTQVAGSGTITSITAGGTGAMVVTGTTAITVDVDPAYVPCLTCANAFSATTNTFTDIKLRSLIGTGTIPTISSGSMVTGSTNNGGSFNSATTGAYTPILTFIGTTAPTGWACSVSNNTTANLIRQTASSTTTATFGGTTVSGDVITYVCIAY